VKALETLHIVLVRTPRVAIELHVMDGSARCFGRSMSPSMSLVDDELCGYVRELGLQPTRNLLRQRIEVPLHF
jgi:hypothetical protein